MRLLFKRGQKHGQLFSLVPLRIGSGTTFTLHAEVELTDEEKKLLVKYSMSTAQLVVSDPIDDLRQSFRPALLLGIITLIVAFFFFSYSTAGMSAVLVTFVMTIVYFRALREQINVNHLTNGGRTFYCDSVVLLIRKEAYLAHICQYLRQILEAAKTWDEREVVDIQPLNKEAAKLAILKEL